MEERMNRRLRKTSGIVAGLAGIAIMYSGWNIALDVLNESTQRQRNPGYIYSVDDYWKDNGRDNLSSLIQAFGLGIGLSGLYFFTEEENQNETQI